MSDAHQDQETATPGIDPEERPGDAAEAAGIVDQQAVAAQAVEEAEEEAGD